MSITSIPSTLAFHLPSETDVLIIGSGPAGLAAALSVRFHSPGIKVAIVDALPSGQNDSRAITIHPRTMEALRSINAVDDFVKEGIQTQGVTLYNGSNRLFRAKYNLLSKKTAYPYLTLLSQAKTESILTEKLYELGVYVYRPYKMVDLRDNESGVLVMFENGHVIKAKYVIGADGARSRVRDLAGIPFTDVNIFGNPKSPVTHDHEHSKQPYLALADIQFESTPFTQHLTQEMSISLGKTGLFLFAPLTKPDHTSEKTGEDTSNVLYRVFFEIPAELKDRALDTTDSQFFQEQVSARLSYLYKTTSSRTEVVFPIIKEIAWRSVFRVHFALASSVHRHLPRSDGDILLIGDAAHVHSPAGGQGMNLGLRDGIDVGEAIAADFLRQENPNPNSRPNSPKNPLTAFSTHRHKEALRIIRLTKLMNFIWTARNPVSRAFRDGFLRFCDVVVPMSGEFVAWRLSGLQYDRYRAI